MQGGGRGRSARLTLSAAFRGERPAVLPPRLVLPPRDLAAALNIGGGLVVTVARGGRVSLSCRGAGGAFCQVASLAGAEEGVSVISDQYVSASSLRWDCRESRSLPAPGSRPGAGGLMDGVFGAAVLNLD